VLGVSGGILVPFIRIFTNKKIIVNIDGLEWRREKWGKWTKKFLKFSERMAVRYSHIDITDNMGIKRYTSINYKTLSQLIAYGGDHVERKELTDETLQNYPFLTSQYAFKVARIEPENNIHLILKSFVNQPFKLVIVGNWKHSQYGINLKKQYQEISNIHLLDAIYDQNILDQLRSNCSIYIHGHSAGGTNPSLVEAMHLEIPILCYDVIYNKETTQYQGHYFKDENDLIKILSTTSEMEWKKNARNMKKIALREYTWKVIAQKYTNIILSLDYRFSKQEILSKLSSLDASELNYSALGHMKNTNLYFE
jgi:glycosyltransferase involved in cell wall biosynthesis